MASSDPKSLSVTQRLERALRRERVRLIMLVVGASFLGVGLCMSFLPFGPSVSNPVVVPNVDPKAGLAFLQALPSDIFTYIAIALAVVGGLILLFSTFLSDIDSPNNEDKTS